MHWSPVQPSFLPGTVESQLSTTSTVDLHGDQVLPASAGGPSKLDLQWHAWQRRGQCATGGGNPWGAAGERTGSEASDGDFGWDGDDFLILHHDFNISIMWIHDNTCIFLGGDLRWYKHLRIWSSRFGDSTVFWHGWLKLQFGWQIQLVDETGSE